VLSFQYICSATKVHESQNGQTFGWTCSMTNEKYCHHFLLQLIQIKVPFIHKHRSLGCEVTSHLMWCGNSNRPATNVGSLWWTHTRFNTTFWNNILAFRCMNFFNFSYRWRLGSSNRLYGVTSQKTVISLWRTLLPLRLQWGSIPGKNRDFSLHYHFRASANGWLMSSRAWCRAADSCRRVRETCCLHPLRRRKLDLLRNVGNDLPGYTALHPRWQQFSVAAAMITSNLTITN
jgi:hypothetical protein